MDAPHKAVTAPIETVRWADGQLHVLDQTRLPAECVAIRLDTLDKVWRAIRTLQVRGAPAIGIAAAFGILVALRERRPAASADARRVVHEAAAHLATARPTAINLFWALDRMKRVADAVPDAEGPESLARRLEEGIFREMITINNLTKTAISEVFIKRIAKIVLKGEKEAREEISIIFVGRKRIKSLNKKYRNKNGETDVLSFNWDENFPATPEDKSYLGEIAICQAIVKKNAAKNNLKFKEELAKVLIHGILHLIGHEHEKRGKSAALMQNKETYYASKV